MSNSKIRKARVNLKAHPMMTRRTFSSLLPPDGTFLQTMENLMTILSTEKKIPPMVRRRQDGLIHSAGAMREKVMTSSFNKLLPLSDMRNLKAQLKQTMVKTMTLSP
tara:strand:+ start:361 stop:681 length:321 start_codon:yes stop_codon:yes gene_type:complete